MLRQRPHPRTLSSVTGSILLVAGLFILFVRLVWAATEWHRLLDTMGERFGVLSSVILASSFGYEQLLHDALHLVWPLLLVAAGSALLHTTDHFNRPAGM